MVGCELPSSPRALSRGALAEACAPRLIHQADILAADIPAGGKTPARAIARMYAALLEDVDGVRLISPDRLREATTPAAGGVDKVFGNPSTWALGYSIGRLGSTAEDSPTAFGNTGAGGSFAYPDTATGIAFALTKNRLTPDFNTVTHITEIVTRAATES